MTCTFILEETVIKQCPGIDTARGKLELRLPKSLTIYNILGLLGTKLVFRHPMQLALTLAGIGESMTPRTRTLGTWVEAQDAHILVALVEP